MGSPAGAARAAIIAPAARGTRCRPRPVRPWRTLTGVERDGGESRLEGKPRTRGTVLQVAEVVQGGDGLARPEDGPVVFLPDAAPGDRVLAELSPTRKGRRTGRILEVVVPGPDRRTPPCPSAGRCGGCQWQHLTEEGQASAVEAQLATALRRIGGLELASVELLPCARPVPATGYRQRARLHADAARSVPVLGFHGASSRRVEPIDSCAVLRPELESLRCGVQAWLPRLRSLVPDAHRVEVQLDLPADDAATARCTLRSRRDTGTSRLRAAAEDLLRTVGDPLRSCELVARGSASRSGARALAGAAAIPHRSGPLEAPERWPAFHSPGGFLQASREGAAWLVSRVARHVQGAQGGGTRALELHAGSGTFTLPLAAACASTCSVERQPRARANARSALVEAGLSAEVLGGDAAVALERLVAEGRRFDLVVLDPPRTGARAEAALLGRTGARRVIYVSCDAPTLARDLAVLSASGFRLVSAEPALLFPQTAHFETIAVLDRE